MSFDIERVARDQVGWYAHRYKYEFSVAPYPYQIKAELVRYRHYLNEPLCEATSAPEALTDAPPAPEDE